MKNLTYFFAMAIMAVIFTSCATMVTVKTDSVYITKNSDTLAVTQEDLLKTQIYLQNSFTLTRMIKEGEKDVNPKRVKIVNGLQVEEISFAEDLKVAIESWDGKYAKVRFENDCDCSLTFAPNDRGVYGIHSMKINGTNKYSVMYDGKEWIVESSKMPTLKFKLRKGEEKDTDSRKAKGVKVK